MLAPQLRGAVQIVAVRSGFAMIFTIISIRRMQHEDPTENASLMFGSRSSFKRLLTRGLFGACAMCLYYLSIQLLTLGDAVTLFFTNAVVTAGASVLLGYEKPTWSMLLACCTCAGMNSSVRLFCAYYFVLSLLHVACAALITVVQLNIVLFSYKAES